MCKDVPDLMDDPALNGYASMRRTASVLGETRYTLWKMVALGELESTMIAGMQVVTVDSINRVLAARKEAATAAAASADASTEGA